VILRRSGTQKNKGEISPPLWEISRFFLGKGKKSIDLESVVVGVDSLPTLPIPTSIEIGSQLCRELLLIILSIS